MSDSLQVAALADDAGAPPRLNVIVRNLRRRAKLTLTELAERAGLAPSTISKIESGQLLPGYETIIRLAAGLEVEVADLFRTVSPKVTSGRRSITRKDCGVKYSSKTYNYEVLASEISKKHFLSLIGTVKARTINEFEELPSHDGEELVVVISGTVRLYSEHYAPVDLEVGDSAYFDSRSGHALVSIGEQDAKVVWICSDPEAIKSQRQKDGA